MNNITIIEVITLPRNKKKKRRCNKIKLHDYVSKKLKSFHNKREKEYSKRLLNRIVNSSILMLWGTYILAWYDKTEIAETLSKTIATSVIAVAVGYLAKSVIENISKNTTTFGENIYQCNNQNTDIDDDVFKKGADNNE